MNKHKQLTTCTLHKHIKTYLLLIALTTTLNLTLQAQHFRLNVFKEVLPPEIHADSIKIHLDTRYKQAVLEKDTSALLKCLLTKSSINRIDLKFAEAFDNAGEAVFLAEEYTNPVLLAKSHEEFGVLYFNFKQDQVANSHFEKSLSNYKEAYKRGLISNDELFQPNYYLSVQQRRLRETEKGKNYLDSCFAIFETNKMDEINRVYLNSEKVEYLVLEDKLDEAKLLLLESIKILEEFSANMPNAKLHKHFLVVLYNSLARIYSLNGNSNLAEQAYEKAIEQKNLGNELIFFTAFVRTNYATLLANKGNYKKAFLLNKTAAKINNTYLNPRNISAQGFLSVKNSYQDELIKKDKELDTKNLELAKKKQEILRFQISLFVIIFLVLLAALMARSRLQQLKHQKKQQLSAEQLEHKNRELTTHMLQLIEKEEIIKTLSEHLEESNPSSSTKATLKALKKQSISLWESFNTRFVEQNGDFYERLQKKVPNLTPAELKLCALIKLNFSGKEMAYLLGMTMNSLHVARHRLRKKLKLERETNLTGFINSI